MSGLDGILGQVTQNVDVAAIAEKFGISPSIAETAIEALGRAHGSAGDTIATAASETGLGGPVLQQIMDQIGGEGALAGLAGLLSENPQLSQIVNLLDQDGDGNPLNDIMGMAKKLFG